MEDIVMEVFVRKLQDFKHYQVDLALVLRRKNKQQIAVLAHKFFDHYLKDLSFQDAVYRYCDLCCAIDWAKVKIVGRRAPTTTINILMLCIAYLIGAYVPPPTEEQVDELASLSDKLRESKHSQDNWLFPKVSILCSAVQNTVLSWESTDILYAKLPSEMKQAFLFEMDGLDQHLSELMLELRQLRKYGVKSSFFTLPYSYTSDYSWVFWGHHDFEQDSPLEGVMDCAAIIALAKTKDLTTLETQPEHITGKRSGVLDQIRLPFPVSLLWRLSWSGELDLGTENNLSLLRSIFESSGKLVEYQYLRLQLVSCLYDLIVPLEIVKSVPSVVIPRSFDSTPKTQETVNKKVQSPISYLIVPRIRSLDDKHLVQEKFEIEIELGEEVTEQRRKIWKRKHEVIAFIRQLPEGHKASPQASALALKEFGIELKEGETFVKKHDRGKGQRITAHKGVQR